MQYSQMQIAELAPFILLTPLAHDFGLGRKLLHCNTYLMLRTPVALTRVQKNRPSSQLEHNQTDGTTCPSRHIYDHCDPKPGTIIMSLASGNLVVINPLHGMYSLTTPFTQTGIMRPCSRRRLNPLTNHAVSGHVVSRALAGLHIYSATGQRW